MNDKRGQERKGGVAFKGGQCGRMDHHVWQVVPGTNNTVREQEAQLSPRDRAMRLVSSNLVNYHATVQKLLIRQVLTKPIV